MARRATRFGRECQGSAQHGIEVCAQHRDLLEQAKCSAEHFLQHPPAGLATPKAVTRGIAICGSSCAAIPLTPSQIATVLDNARHDHEQGGAEQDGRTGGQGGGARASEGAQEGFLLRGQPLHEHLDEHVPDIDGSGSEWVPLSASTVGQYQARHLLPVFSRIVGQQMHCQAPKITQMSFMHAVRRAPRWEPA